jgi:signal transduction histidine kinase
MQCGDKIPKECLSYIQGIYESNLRMNHLIETLLNFSRLVHRELNRESIDMYAMAHEVAIALTLSDPERLVDFHITNGIKAHADKNLLRVVIDNLFGNAWKYTGQEIAGSHRVRSNGERRKASGTMESVLTTR